MRVVVAADLRAGLVEVAALVDGAGDLAGGVALQRSFSEVLCLVDGEEWGGVQRTALPQVTEPWRFSIWAGAAKAVARRPKVAMREVYILIYFDVRGKARVYMDM